MLFKGLLVTVLILWPSPDKGGTKLTVLLVPKAVGRVVETCSGLLTVLFTKSSQVTEPAVSVPLSMQGAGVAGCECDEPIKSDVDCSTGNIATPALLASDCVDEAELTLGYPRSLSLSNSAFLVSNLAFILICCFLMSTSSPKRYLLNFKT